MNRRQQPLAWVFFALVALSRWPGLMPPNFQPMYALIFCCSAFFTGRMGWAVPLGVLVGSDLVLDVWYQWGKGYDVFNSSTLVYLCFNYLGYLPLYLLGRQVGPGSSFIKLLAGGIVGGILFYLISNSLSWLINYQHAREYTRDLAGWIRALTTGSGAWPQTWEFFRNTLLSSALFTGLFSAAWRYTTAESPAEKGECVEAPEGQPEEAGA
jgi:hypothetical protein